MRFRRLTYGVIVSGAAAWCGLILLAPVLSAHPSLAPFGAIVYAFFAPLCHQIDGRSFHLLGEPLAVCGRCTSVYFGFLAGALAYPAVAGRLRGAQRGAALLVVAAAPMAVEVIVETLGFSASSNIVRAVTGGWLGVILPLVVVPGACEGVGQLMASPKPSPIQPAKGHPHA